MNRESENLPESFGCITAEDKRVMRMISCGYNWEIPGSIIISVRGFFLPISIRAARTVTIKEGIRGNIERACSGPISFPPSLWDIGGIVLRCCPDPRRRQ